MPAGYARVSRTPLAGSTPEQARGVDNLREVLRRLGEGRHL